MILDQRCYDNDDNDDGSFISMTRLSPWPPRPPPHRCQAAWPWLGCGEKWRKIINVQDNHVRVSCTRAQKGQTSHLRLVAALWRAGTQSMSMPCPQCPQCPVVPGSSTHWPVVPTPPPPLTPVTRHGLLQPPGQPRAAAQTGLRQLPLPRGVHNNHPQGLWRHITRETVYMEDSAMLW